MKSVVVSRNVSCLLKLFQESQGLMYHLFGLHSGMLERKYTGKKEGNLKPTTNRMTKLTNEKSFYVIAKVYVMIAFTISRTTAKFFLSQLASQRQTDEKFLMIASWIWLLQPTSCEFLSSTSAAQHFLHFYIIRFISFDVNCVKCKYRVLLSTVARHYTLTYLENKFHQHLELCVSKSLPLY